MHAVHGELQPRRAAAPKRRAYRDLDVSYHETGSLRLAAARSPDCGGPGEFCSASSRDRRPDGVPFEIVPPDPRARAFPAAAPQDTSGRAARRRRRTCRPTAGSIPPRLPTAWRVGPRAAGADPAQDRRSPPPRRARLAAWSPQPQVDVTHRQAAWCVAPGVVVSRARSSRARAPPAADGPARASSTSSMRTRPSRAPPPPVTVCVRETRHASRSRGAVYVRQDDEGLCLGPLDPRDPRTAWDSTASRAAGEPSLLRPDLRRHQATPPAGSLRAPPPSGAGGHPGLEGDQRPGRIHAGRASPEGPVAGGEGSGCSRLQLLRHRLLGRRGELPGRVDPRRAAERQHVGARRPPLRLLHADTDYIVARARESYEREYDIHFPEEERPAGRPLKTGPLYDRLRERGAVFGARFGWERPLWFAKNGGPSETSTPSDGVTGTTPSAASAAPSAQLSACSTRRASRSTRSRGPVRNVSSTGSARTGFRRRSGACA